MENPQMAMPAEMAAQGPNPEEMAIYDRMRQEISPQEFSNEMLASASQVDPQAVAEFTEELRSLDVSPEELDALNDLVDQILAAPEQYDQLRQQFLAQGMPDDILPEQFDPYFFAALNMAVDQMIAAPTGVQAFAEGGIAELKPIAQAIASYGRNGDTMLAHITPAEARMLRRRGGSGTINPATGLPEFFLKKVFKSIGKAVKKFVNSTVGRIVTTVALGFFLGPAAASMLGVTSAAGVAAVGGFVGSAGSTLLGGGNLKDALKAGAVGGLTAGAGAGIMGGADAFASGSYTGPTTVGGQVDKFKSAITPGAPAISPTGQAPGQVPVPEAGAPAAGVGPNQMPVSDADPLGKFIQQNEAARAAANTPAGAYRTPTIGESFSKMGEGLGMGDKPASFETFKQGATDLFSPGPTNAQVSARAQEIMRTTPGTSAKDAMALASKEMSPGILRTYGPAAVAGTGIMALSGGFETKPVQGGPITQSLMKEADQRIREKGTQRQMYMQGLPGVVYDEFGAPVFGQSSRLPTYDVPDYNYGGFGMPGQGGMDLPPVYVPPSGAIGSSRVEQPYNTSDMYSNLMPRRYADGGQVQYFDDGGPVAPVQNQRLPANFNWEQYVAANPDLGRAGIDTQAEAQEHWLNNGFKENRALNSSEATQREAARVATLAEQKAARDRVAQQKAMRRAAGSGAMYANINAGLSALAPETNPMDTTDTTFGARNRQAQLANLQQTYGPMLEGQRAARTQQAQALGQATGPVPSPFTAAPPVDRYSQMVQDQYARIGRTGFGGETSQIDVPGFNHFVNELQTGRIRPEELSGRFDSAVQDYMRANPNDRYTRHVRDFQERQERPITTLPITPPPGSSFDGRPMPITPPPDSSFDGRPGIPPEFLNMGGIAALGQGGYPRRTGQISGPGTEKSDSIPAMLSDGEFVMTAKAVRGAGKGSRRAGAKQMYKLMHQLEKNAERG